MINIITTVNTINVAIATDDVNDIIIITTYTMTADIINTNNSIIINIADDVTNLIIINANITNAIIITTDNNIIIIITADVPNITISIMSLLLLHSKIIVTLLNLPLSIMRYYKDYI